MHCAVAFETEVTDKMIQFLDNVFARDGLPEFLVTDNGVQLTSHKMKEFLEGNGITHLLASLYHQWLITELQTRDHVEYYSSYYGKVDGACVIFV